VRKIYEKDHRNRMSREVVAKHLGYGSLNGVSLSVLSALTKFGLLESIDNDLQVSADAVTMLVDTPGSPDRIAAIRRASFKPDLFMDLNKYFGAQLPSEDNLLAYLQKQGFTRNAALIASRSYRETMELVSKLRGPYDGAVKSEANGMEAVQKGAELGGQDVSQTFTVALDPLSSDAPKFGKVILPVPLTADQKKRLKAFIESL